MKSRTKLFSALVSFILILSTQVSAEPIGSAFTYQGSLQQAGGPADGVFDFEFKLFAQEAGGNQTGGTVAIEDVTVNGGLFTAPLDFGAGIIQADALWLDISVRPGDSAGAFTTLSPRQKLNPVPFAMGLSLPYNVLFGGAGAVIGLTQTGNGPVFTALASGLGTGIQSNIVNPSNGAPALAGTTNGTGNALLAQTSGTGRAALIRQENDASPSPALEVTTIGMGQAGLFTNTNTSNNGTVVDSSTMGTGSAGSFRIVNAGNSNPALFGQSNGSGAAIEGLSLGTQSQAGVFEIRNINNNQRALETTTAGAGPALYANSDQGRAGFFQNSNAGNDSDTLRSQSNSSGNAIFGFNSGDGPGVRGDSVDGPGLMAVAPTEGTALEIGGGTIKVTGAGIGTPSTVFIHLVTSGSLVEGRAYESEIDNVLTNNHPEAILLITHNGSPNGAFSTVNPHPVGVRYYQDLDKWVVRNLDLGDIEVGSHFNIMVVYP